MKHRLERVREVIKRELGMAITRTLTFDGALVTVNGVDITPDLKQAHIFIGIIGNDSQKKHVVETLEKNRSLLQQELSKRVVLKYTPILNFRVDDSVERGTRVIDLMDNLGLSHKNPEDVYQNPEEENEDER
ncbi:MAG: 30S ribosome-binding factor RbfA [Chthoniobacterales bacterium]